MTSTSPAARGLDPIQTTNLSPNTAPVEMDELDTSKKSKLVSGTSGLLNDISIPETSPITSDYPSYPSTSSSVLPATTATTATTTKTTNTTTEMVDSSNQNASVGDDGSTSQEALTAQPVTNEETSSIDPAPAPPQTMSKSEGKAPATESSSDAQESSTSRPRMNSEAIGPSLEITKTPPPPPTDGGPRLLITLLLTSGARHPYKIDEKYLTKRSVAVPGVTENGKKDPLTISVYTLKELILREWRDEWETKPSSPSSIRLIFFGRLLDDKDPLKACKFNPETSNVVHMTIRPQDIVDEEDASKAKSMGRGRGEDGESTAGCRCVIL